MKSIFTEVDYNSNDGMVTNIWGPSLWHVLHTISFNYPVNPTSADKKNYKQFILSLRDVLPCRACRENFADNIKQIPLKSDVFKNRKNFSKWVFKLHNHVNKMTGKKFDKTYNETRDLYENFRARCTKEGNSKLESGCGESLYGVKSKITMSIVPKENKTKTFNMSEKCRVKKKNYNFN